MKCPKCGSDKVIPIVTWSFFKYECICGHQFNKKDNKKGDKMKIYTKQFNADDFIHNSNVLRWFYIDEDTIEASIIEGATKLSYNHLFTTRSNHDFTVIHIVPTGVQANFGGYIADATPVTNVMAEIADTVITHPNVLNGSYLNYGASNILYVEGYSLDKFLEGRLALNPVRQNKIGVILDKKGFEEDGNLAINTIESLRAILGIDVVDYIITDEPIGGKAIRMPSGAFSGEVKNPKTLLDAAYKLYNKGANAIAISTFINMKKKDLNAYFRNEIPNPMGGTEALISHLISRNLEIPCAHAPIISKEEKALYESKGIVDPRAASEVVSPGYLGCILKGLNKAPQITYNINDITVFDVDAIVIPYGCCGGVPAFEAQYKNIPIIAVKENTTVLSVTPGMMNLKNVKVVDTYLECFGILAAMKAGISLDSVMRPLYKLK